MNDNKAVRLNHAGKACDCHVRVKSKAWDLDCHWLAANLVQAFEILKDPEFKSGPLFEAIWE